VLVLFNKLIFNLKNVQLIPARITKCDRENMEFCPTRYDASCKLDMMPPVNSIWCLL